jgi:hypothetical protein
MDNLEQFGLGLQIDTAQVTAADAKAASLEAQLRDLNDVVQRMAPGWELAKAQIAATTAALDQARAASERLRTAFDAQAAAAQRAANAQANQVWAAAQSEGAAAQTRAEIAALGPEFGGPSGLSTASRRMIRDRGWAGDGAGASGGGGGGGRSGGGGMADRGVAGAMFVMTAGAAMEDAQYGFRAVANNLPMVVSSFAMLAGASGPAGMAIGGLVATIGALGSVAYNNSETVKGFVDGILNAFRGTTPEQAATIKAQEAQRAKMQADASKAIDASIANDPQTRKRAEAFQKALDQFGAGKLADIFKGSNQSDTYGLMLGKAQAGDADAARWIDEQMRGRDGNWSNARHQNRTLTDAEKRSDDLVKLEQKRSADEEWQATLKAAEATRDFSSLQSDLVHQYEAQKLTLQELSARLGDVDRAAKQAADAEAKLAEKRAEAAEKEAQEREDALRKSEEDAAKTAEQKQEKREQNLAGMYGQAWGGDVARTMMARMARGENAEDVADSMRKQIAGRMQNIADPGMRARVAGLLVDQARGWAEQQGDASAVMGDVRGVAMAGQMGQRGSSMRAMQEQWAQRQGINVKAYDAAVKSPAEMGAKEMRESVREFGDAVRELQRGITITL